MNATKIAILIVIVIALGGAAYIILNPQTTESPSNQQQENTTTEEDNMEETMDQSETDSMMEEDTTTAEEESASGEVIDLTGTNYEFSQETIEVEVGEPVTIEFTSNEGMHDWVIDQFNAATERVNQGQTTSVTFTPTEIGEFEYYCSVGNHRELGMVGTLVVTE